MKHIAQVTVVVHCADNILKVGASIRQNSWHVCTRRIDLTEVMPTHMSVLGIKWMKCICNMLAVTLQDRDHLKFVCKLKDYVSDRKQLLDRIPGALEQAGLTVEEAELSDAEKYLEKDYFKNTKLVDLQSGHQRTCDVHPASGSIAPGLNRAVNPPGSEH